MRQYYKIPDKRVYDHLEINRQSAFHQAGHAAAIFFENNRKNLPSIYFQIQLLKLNGLTSPFLAKICGGRQIADPLMISQEDSFDVNGCQIAYEADIINYLAGPLSEAKYVSIRDNVSFNVNVFKPYSLYNYLGTADRIEIGLYLESFLPSLKERETKLNQLFVEAFHFIQDVENWKRITALANHILNSAEDYISFDQVSEVLQQKPQLLNIQ
jgi:hypothetical protein